MAELRWILLGLGLALIAGIWAWGRRQASAGEETRPVVRESERQEPRLDADYDAEDEHEHAHGADPRLDEELLPTVEMPARGYDERKVSGANPPVVTIDDLPDNVEDVVLVDGPPPAPPVVVAPPPPPPKPPAPAPVPTLTPEAGVATPPPRPRPPPPPSSPVIPPNAPLASVDPLADTIVERQRKAKVPPAEPPPRQQRIVAIRLIAQGEQRIDGGQLRTALDAERLTFGRYSIYHRLLEGDRPVYSVASLVEPGSFDPDLMASVRFPGISLFAVFPGPLPAPQAFDELLATARRLADKLGGVLQDDAGSSLTGQRVLSLREELVHFEHLVAIGRGRPGP